MTSCGCVYVDVGEYFETLSEEVLIAKTPWFICKCDECGRALLEGVKYERYTGQIYDGEPKTFRTCEDCISIREEFFCDGWAFTTILEDVGNYVDDAYGEIPSDCLLRLTPRARGMVIKMIDDVFKDMRDEDD